jgi:hypothetical protein
VDIDPNSVLALPVDTSSFAAVDLRSAYTAMMGADLKACYSTFMRTDIKAAYSATMGADLQECCSRLTGIDLQTAYSGFTGIDLQAAYSRLTGIDLQAAYSRLTGIDLQVADRDPCADGVLLSTDGVYEVSGKFLHDTTIEMKLLQEKQCLLDAQLESLRTQRAEAFEIYRVTDGRMPTVTLEALHTFLTKKWTHTKARIVRLRRCYKAVKRALRRRQWTVFARLTSSEKVWYLLHGTHPPEAQYLELPFGGVLV